MAGVPTKQELLHRYLPAYMQGKELPSGGAIRSDVDPLSRSPDKLPGILFYTNCVHDQKNKRRRVNDNSGYWISRGGQLSVLEEGKVIGFKQTFNFCLPNNTVTPWEMTEYTIQSSKSVENQKAILAIRKARNSGP